MAGLDELNRFECPGPSAPFASADVAILKQRDIRRIKLSNVLCDLLLDRFR